MLTAIVRIRGSVGVRKEIKDTMKMLCLTENNHCVVCKENPVLTGMLFKVKDYVTFGEIDKITLTSLIKKRGRLLGDKRITDEWLKTNKMTLDKLVEQFEKDPKSVYTLGLKKVFRLSPPSKGFGKVGIKYPFVQKGALGNRKEAINLLLKRMI
ncbi:MAG: 50S ribosomal protein L30 [Candidatus Diapherotrites archaeon CG08_land_8_20_14_0_20_30_16]|nr:MAG: 50S ribosomal protein L30 [Candidatus Diapherotrites archaeon CG08_land_8_20_14_0_20_30_16]